MQVTATSGAGSTIATSDPTAVVQSAGGPPGSLGRVTVGSLSVSGGSGYLDASGPYQLSVSATVQRLIGYLRGGASNSPLRAVIYADDGAGSPGSIVAVSSEALIGAGTPAGWVEFPLPAPITINPGSYWVGYWIGSPGTNVLYYDVLTGAERFSASPYSSTGNAASTFPRPMGTSDGAYSLYADYSTAANSPANSSPPTITGSPIQDQTLTAGPGTWSGNPAFAYQWLRCDSTGGNCTTIAGAATTTYLIQAGDVNATIRVRVTATNSNGQNVATSDKTGVIQTAAPPPERRARPGKRRRAQRQGHSQLPGRLRPVHARSGSNRPQADRLPERRQLEHEDCAPSSTRTIAIPASPYGAESVFRATSSASPARSPSPPAPRRAGSTSPSRPRSPSRPASTGSATGTATKRPTPTTTASPATSATPPPTTPRTETRPSPFGPSQSSTNAYSLYAS